MMVLPFGCRTLIHDQAPTVERRSGESGVEYRRRRYTATATDATTHTHEFTPEFPPTPYDRSGSTLVDSLEAYHCSMLKDLSSNFAVYHVWLFFQHSA